MSTELTNRAPRMRDVAKHLNVSTATVSLALQGSPRISVDMRQRVIDAVKSLGYDLTRISANPAASVRLQRLGFLSINQPVASPNDDTSLAPMTRVFSENAVDFGATVSIQSITGDPLETKSRRRIEDFASDMDGLLISGIVGRPLIRLLHQLAKPFLVLGYTELEPADPDAVGLHQVAVDSVAMGRCATEHLLAKGCKSIAFMAPQFIKGFTYELWLRGYYSALASAGVPTSQALVSKAYPDDVLFNFLANVPHIDGLVSPDHGVVTSLLDPKRRPPNLPLENIAVGVTNTRVARRGGFEQCPLIICDVDDLARAAIPRLLHLLKYPDPVGSILVRPFTTANIRSESNR